MDDERAASMARSDPIARADVRPALGFAALAVAIGGHGLVWPMARLGVQWMPPLWFGFARMVTAAAFLFVLLALLRQFRLPSRQDMPIIIALGVFMMGLFICLSHLGMVTVGSGRAALLGYSTPLWVTPVAVLFLGERLGVLKGAGLVIGVAGAWGLTGILESLLFNVDARDPVTFAAGPVLLTLVAIAACWIPARRATMLDPVTVLREE